MQFYKRQSIVVLTTDFGGYVQLYVHVLCRSTSLLLDESNTDQIDLSKDVNECVSTYVLFERM